MRVYNFYVTLRKLASRHHTDLENEANREKSRGKIWKNQAPWPLYEAWRQALLKNANTWTSQWREPPPSWFCLWWLYRDFFFFLSLRPDWILISFFLRFYLVIHERHRERGRDIGRGRSRFPTGSQTQDSIPGPWNHNPRQRQTLNHWATQVPLT